MTSFTDVISSICSLCNETCGDILLIRSPFVGVAKSNIVKVYSSILRHSQGDSIYYTTIQSVVPLFLNSDEVRIQSHVLDRALVILCRYVCSIRNGYRITRLCCPVVGSFYLVCIRLQGICSRRSLRRCGDFHNLRLFSIGKTCICLQTIIQICYQVIRCLAGPNSELDHIGDAILQLEVFTHIPMDCAVALSICSCRAAIRFTGCPLSFISIAIAILIVLAAIAIVFEAARVDSLHDFHLSIGQCCDSVSHFNIAEAKYRFDRLGDGLKSPLHSSVIGCDERMICSNSTFSS